MPIALLTFIAAAASIIVADPVPLRLPITGVPMFVSDDLRRAANAPLNGTPSYGFTVDLDFGTPDQTVRYSSEISVDFFLTKKL